MIDCNGRRFTQTEVATAIRKLKDKKSPGPDNIPAAILKGLVNRVPWEITDIVNYGVQNKLFSDIWKESKVVLLPKRESHTEYYIQAA